MDGLVPQNLAQTHILTQVLHYSGDLHIDGEKEPRQELNHPRPYCL